MRSRAGVKESKSCQWPSWHGHTEEAGQTNKRSKSKCHGEVARDSKGFIQCPFRIGNNIKAPRGDARLQERQRGQPHVPCGINANKQPSVSRSLAQLADFPATEISFAIENNAGP